MNHPLHLLGGDFSTLVDNKATDTKRDSRSIDPKFAITIAPSEGSRINTMIYSFEYQKYCMDVQMVISASAL
jgi:hypothetical protein